MDPSKDQAEESVAEQRRREVITEQPAQAPPRNGGSEAPAAPFRERRKRPRISETPPAAPPPPKLDDYEPIIGKPELDELRFLARPLRGKTVKMVNSTSMGGGVAEMLNRLIPLLGEVEVVTRWDVITGGNDFFEVTKAFHNALHGGEYVLTKEARDIFLMYNEQNRQRMQFTEDLFVVHDPQPLGLIRSRERNRGKWMWRCHIDLSNPHPDVWGFLRPMVEEYDATVFSSPAFSRQLMAPQYLFFPCIDPLSEKNKELDAGYIQKVCEDFGIDRSRPIVTQISRFDRLKDPVGVIQAYKLAKKYVDCQLVLAGGGATDDPEGAIVLQEVMDAAGEDPDVIILNLPPWSALEINALQRASTVVVQKSLKEGFGLTVTEALWKGKPTIAGAVGGIPTQVIHKLTGVLVHSIEGCAYQIRYLLTHPEFAEQMGKNGREHVKENFLMTSNVKRWLLLFQILLGMLTKEKTT
ncbi:MAG TPA: glycosyltransferase [Terriglobales bacterium]|jgi:trehalose synthase|nr:glycosyltransferase [Terriglobales bacterium]